MPSYEASGKNRTKLLRELHHNTMSDVWVFRSGRIRTDDGAAAWFNGVHILEKVGQWGDLIPWPNGNGWAELEYTDHNMACFSSISIASTI